MLALLITFSLITTSYNDQTPLSAPQPVYVFIGDTLPKLEEVNNAAADIDAKISTYRIVEKDESDKEQNLTVAGYYDKSGLKKMSVEYSNSGGKMTFDYYFDKTGLFYVQRNVLVYGIDANTSDTAVVGAEAEKCYFYKGRMFAWVNAEKKPMSTGTKRFKKQEEQLLGEMERGKKILEKK